MALSSSFFFPVAVFSIVFFGWLIIAYISYIHPMSY
jgi:hypothetical protein